MTKALDLEYRSIIEELGGDVEGRLLARRCIDCSSAIYHGNVVDTLYVPKLFDARTLDALRNAAQTTHRILCKATLRYLEDEGYRRLFGFSPQLESLIMLPTGYEQPIPIARVDVFLDEETLDFTFCEFNTDGSSAMNEERELGDALALTPAYREMAKRHEMHPFALFDPWVDAFGRIYSTFENCVENPHVAIVDFLEMTTPNEIDVFCRRFRHAGYDCRVIDARALTWDGKALRDADGWMVDAIYRRAVTSDCVSHMDEIDALISAVKELAVCLIGGFVTQVAHSKNIFEVLRLPQTTEFLDEAEREFIEAHVPFTAKLKRGSLADECLANKGSWLIKPQNSYGADDISAGCALEQDEWERRIAERLGRGYVLQRFAKLYKTQNLQQRRAPGTEPNPDWEWYNNLTGLYLYDGRFCGVYSRASKQPLISDKYGGATVLTLAVDAPDSAGEPRVAGRV